MRYCYIPIERPKSRIPTTLNAGKNLKQQKLSSTAGGNANDTASLEDNLAASYKPKYNFTT